MSAADALRAHLLADLEAATAAAVKAADAERARPMAEAGAPDAAGVLAAVAHVAYFNGRLPTAATLEDLARPADRLLPTAEALAAWLLGSPESLPLAAAVAKAAWLPPADAHTEHQRWAHRAAERWLIDFAPVLPGNRKPSAPLPFAVLFLSDLVIACLAAGRPRAPLFALVDAWELLLPLPVKVDRHVGAIMPASLRDATRDHDTLPLGLDRLTPLGPIRAPEEGYLPGLEPPPSLVPPVPWLTLYDLASSGLVQNRGRGAPLAQRLFVEVLTAVHVGARDPEWITAPPITLRDLFDWCWPRYFDPLKWNNQTRQWGDWAGGYQRNKHLEPLRRALIELDNLRILFDRYERRLIRVDDLPTAETALDDPIRFHVRHLPGSDRGPMLVRTIARRWGVASAPAWRGTIRLAYVWDEAKARNNGARVYATRPLVARGPGGVILGADDKPLRDRRGAVVKDWSDPRAVHLGANRKPAGAGNPPAWERNPAADRVPMFGADDLIRLTYDGNITRSNRRERLHQGREAMRAKADAGEVVIETDAGDGWRIIEARPGQATRIRADADPDTC